MEKSSSLIRENQFNLQKPSLYKRIFSGIIDVVFFLIITLGLELGAFYSVFESLGYRTYIENVQTMYKDSHLFTYSDKDGYLALNELDQEDVTTEDYDNAIIYYYSTNEYAISNNALEQYNKAKLDSNLYDVVDGEYVLKDVVSEESALKFLTNCYSDALDLFYSNPDFIHDSNASHNIILYGTLIVIILSSSIYYILIPLIIKNRVTLGEVMFRFVLVNNVSNTKATFKACIVRNVVFILFNIVATFLIYLYVDYLAFIPMFITILMLCFTKKNLTPHDYMSNTYLVSKDTFVNQIIEIEQKPKDDKKDYHLDKI